MLKQEMIEQIWAIDTRPRTESELIEPAQRILERFGEATRGRESDGACVREANARVLVAARELLPANTPSQVNAIKQLARTAKDPAVGLLATTVWLDGAGLLDAAQSTTPPH